MVVLVVPGVRSVMVVSGAPAVMVWPGLVVRPAPRPGLLVRPVRPAVVAAMVAMVVPGAASPVMAVLVVAVVMPESVALAGPGRLVLMPPLLGRRVSPAGTAVTAVTVVPVVPVVPVGWRLPGPPVRVVMVVMVRPGVTQVLPVMAVWGLPVMQRPVTVVRGELAVIRVRSVPAGRRAVAAVWVAPWVVLVLPGYR